MTAHLGGDCTTLARLYKITRKDGTVFTFTDHDQDVDTTGVQGVGAGFFTDGGHVFEAAIGFSPTAIENKNDFSVDNQEATAFIDSDTIKETDLRFGVWDSAAVEIRVFNWSDLSQGELKIRKGSLGNTDIKNGLLTSQILGLTNRLQILIGRAFGPSCTAELGDERCQATVPSENGSVASSADAHHLTPNSGLTGIAGYYDDGIVLLTSGINSGLAYQIGSWDGTEFVLKNPLFVAPTAGDTFTVEPGCKHDVVDCNDKFDNLVNNRSFPTMPGPDEILTYPDATS